MDEDFATASRGELKRRPGLSGRRRRNLIGGGTKSGKAECEDHDNFVPDLDAALVDAVDAAKRRIASLPAASQAAAAADLAAALLDGLDRLRAVDDADRQRLHG